METYKRPLEELHDSVSHALQRPKPTIATCDADNTATSVNKNGNDNKVNCATDEDSACTMTLTVPNAIKKVVIFKNGKRSILLGNIDAINKSYYFLTVLNLIQHLIFYSADNAWGISQQLLPPFNLLYRYIVVRWPKAIFSSCRQSEQWGKSMVLMIK